MKKSVAGLLLGLLVVGCPKRNHAPETSSAPFGPSMVARDSLTSFCSLATDPDGDSVAIRFDWGDGDTSDWSQYVESDEQVRMKHAWSAIAVCSVRARARDQGSLTSTWSPAYAVNVSSTFGGVLGDGAHSVQQTWDGGYIIAGHTASYGAGQSDVWLIKTGAGGSKVWDRTFGGADEDSAHSVQQTSDGGYIITGSTESYGAGWADVWLIKTDANGNRVWDKTFGGEYDDKGYSLQQTSDGGFIIAGYTESFSMHWSDVWLIKTDADGNKAWDRVFGGVGFNSGNSVQQTSDGGYVIVGFTDSYGAGGADVWLIKTDADGNEVWDRTFGGAREDSGCSVQQTSDGGYIITGSTNSAGASWTDVWLIKTDADGNKVWDRMFGGMYGDFGCSVQQTASGEYITAGTTYSYGTGTCSVWLIKTDADGNKVWDRVFSQGDWNFGYAVQQTSDGGYVIVGQTWPEGADHSDVLLIKTPGP